MMKKIRVPWNGKGYTVAYKVETIDLSMTAIGYLNAYTVSSEEAVINKLIGESFTILHNSTQTIQPCFEQSPNIEANNLRKTIAQQIINNPTE